MGIRRSSNFPNYLSVGAAAVTRGLLFTAFWGPVDFNKYLHRTHTCSNLSSRDASKELSPGKKSAVFLTAMQIAAQWDRNRPNPGTPACKSILTWNQWKDHASWRGLQFNYEKGKGGAGAGKRKTPRVCCPFRGDAGLTPMLCRSRRAARRSRWERWPGRERRGSALRCAPSLSVAGRYPPPPGKRLPWDSRGQHAASLLCRQKGEAGGKRENALKGLSTGEMVCSQEYSLQGKTTKCPLRFSSSFKKTQQILKAKENQIFLLCLETTAAYYEGLIQGPRLTSEDFESGARMA